MRNLAPLALALAVFAAPASALAGDLQGRVRDHAGQPVAGATVTIPALGLTSVTGADGVYRFEGLDAGEHRIAVELAADARQFATAQVPETGEVTRNLFLYSRATLDHARGGLDPVEAMLAELLMAQAWEEASEMAAQAETRDSLELPELVG